METKANITDDAEADSDLQRMFDEILEETGGPMTPEEEAWVDTALDRHRRR